MNHANSVKFLLVSIFIFFVSLECTGQEKPGTDSMQIKLHTIAKEIMTAAKTCTLITLDEDGRPAARIMDPFPPEENFTVWFGTNTYSRKVGQIKNDPRATIFYVSPDMSGYVLIQGNANLVNDPEEKTRRWKKEWEQFYPGGRENYLLIRVEPLRFEVVSYPHGLTGDPVTWTPQSVTLQGN